MRLLPQPLFRYGSEDSEVVDGALYAFVQGTDPEVILRLEARQTDDGPEWQYALARMNSVKFVAQYQGREVWRRELCVWKDVKSGGEPYVSFGPFHASATDR